jgi:ubiquinone/menaquinone biosynthesis C-methylase UbiE
MGSIMDAGGAERAALAELADFTNKRVLEVGCGDGRMTWLYAHDAADVLGIDTDAELIEQARAAIPLELAQRVTFRVADAQALDVPRPRFDIAFLSWSL